MALFGNKRADKAERQIAQLLALVPVEVFQGQGIDSPYVESAPVGRSLVPWRRGEITEAAPSGPTKVQAVNRHGFIPDVPRGGANEYNQGYSQIGGATDRKTLMHQLQMLYISCPWSAACIDAIARFSSAGGMSIEPDDETNERKETVKLSSQAQKCQDLFDYVNPTENFRQLMRGIFTDLLIYGDAFIEVVWALGEPIGLYSLPSADMLVDADEHGEVNYYVQRTDTDRRAQFDPHQVLHISFDNPRGGLYGLGPTEKAVHPITTWLFTEGLLKATVKKGDPPNLAIAWDENMSENEIKEWSQKYRSRNLGPDNVGNPVEGKGKTEFHELVQNKLAEYDAVKSSCRDEICGAYGTPPAIVTIIESGNLGGGTGSSQFKNFKINTCGPIQELVLEALTFSILRQGFGVADFRCQFGEVDWRDDAVIETIRTQRVERAGWTVNRYRDDIGEPPVEGGDDALIIQTRDVVLLKDAAAMSAAAVDKAENPILPTLPDIGGQPPPPQVLPEKGAPPDKTGMQKPDPEPPAHAKPVPAPKESMTDAELYETWSTDYEARLAQAMKDLPKVDAP